MEVWEVGEVDVWAVGACCCIEVGEEGRRLPEELVRARGELEPVLRICACKKVCPFGGDIYASVDENITCVLVTSVSPFVSVCVGGGAEGGR